MPYRQDIQILRGLAVVLVVLFHLGAAAVPSGFLGVDVFFVISGFLMALLYRPGEAYAFYERRARRLMPAYFATVIVTLLVAMVVTLPVEGRQVVEQSLFATVFASNIGFWMQNSYFSKSEFTPLLHLWSLGVEIQFYLLVPALFLVGRRTRWLLPLVAVGALLAAFAVTSISPKTTFFMMPLRIWQFLIGWLIAWNLTDDGQVRERWWNGIGGGLSLSVLLIAPMVGIAPQAPDMLLGHPGVLALVVSLATGGVLACGLPTKLARGWPGRGFERLGRYSYSIYLAHFPIIVLALYEPFSGTVMPTGSAGDTMLLLGMIVAASAALYGVVERQGAQIYSGRRLATAMVATAGLAVAAGPLTERFYDPIDQRIFAAWTDRAEYRCGKVIRVLNPRTISCELTGNMAADAAKILLVGDSHADALKTAFAEAAEDQGVRVFFLVPNDPLTNPKYSVAELTHEARALGVDSVFVHYATGNVPEETIEAFRAALASAGIGMTLLTPVPTFEKHVPQELYRHHAHGDALPVLTLTEYHAKNRDLISYARDQKAEGFAYYDLGAALCALNCRLMDDEGRPAYFDAGHLTLSGGRLLQTLLSEAIANRPLLDLNVSGGLVTAAHRRVVDIQ